MRSAEAGIIMNGVTGRMGLNQHLIRSILAIRKQGGLPLSDGSILMPDPILVRQKRRQAQGHRVAHGLSRWSTDLARASRQPEDTIYFDSGSTGIREQNVLQAIAAGKHVYCEKPLSTTMESAIRLARAAEKAGVKAGVVQDKLFLPGMRKLRRLIDSGFFGRILTVRGEFGYWVFEGDWQTAQRPSWNYRKEDDGGIILDMYLPLALCSGPHVWFGAGGQLHRRDPHSAARRRSWEQLKMHSRRRCLRYVRVRRRHLCADQFIVGYARLPR